MSTLGGIDEGFHHSSTTHPPYVILFLAVSIMVGAVIRYLLLNLPVSLPYTVLMMVFGCIFGLLVNVFPEELTPYTALGHVDPHLILHIFIPIIIFDSAFSMEAHTFFHAMPQVRFFICF